MRNQSNKSIVSEKRIIKEVKRLFKKANTAILMPYEILPRELPRFSDYVNSEKV